jgi:hypothetical protein
VLAMAVTAHRGSGDSCLHGLSVNACKISLADFSVALATGGGDIPVIDFGARILRRQDSVAAVTI